MRIFDLYSPFPIYTLDLSTPSAETGMEEAKVAEILESARHLGDVGKLDLLQTYLKQQQRARRDAKAE